MIDVFLKARWVASFARILHPLLGCVVSISLFYTWQQKSNCWDGFHLQHAIRTTDGYRPCRMFPAAQADKDCIQVFSCLSWQDLAHLRDPGPYCSLAPIPLSCFLTFFPASAGIKGWNTFFQ